MARKSKDYLKQKFQSGEVLTDEDLDKMNKLLSYYYFVRRNTHLKCITTANNEYVVSLFRNEQIYSTNIIYWLEFFDVNLEDYYYLIDNEYDPLEGITFDFDNLNHIYVKTINEILHEIQEDDLENLKKIYNIAFAQGWDIPKETFEISNYNSLNNILSKWLKDNDTTKLYKLIAEAITRALIVSKHEETKEAIEKYLNDNFSKIFGIDNNVIVDWFDSYFSLSLKPLDVIQMYEKDIKEENTDFIPSLQDHFKIHRFSYYSSNSYDEEYALNFILDNLPR